MIPAPKKPRSLPVVLSPEEVVQFLDGVKAAKHHAILTTCYAAGLRISEAVHYVETVARFARYFDRSPARLGPEEIRGYQVYLTNERRLAPSSLVVAESALRFHYRVTLQKR